MNEVDESQESLQTPSSGNETGIFAPFLIKDCALAAIATGLRAHNLRELQDRLRGVPEACIYHHFLGFRLRPSFDYPVYHNDFALWVRNVLQEPVLAERLAVIDPADFTDLEGLRSELLEVIENRLDEMEFVPWSKPDKQFSFVRSQVVIISTNVQVDAPRELSEIIPRLSAGSIFYHFIDARRRTPGSSDDFSHWMRSLGGYEKLCQQLANVDPYFPTLLELRQQLAAIFNQYFLEGTP
jgi:hypothetical protein